MSDSSHDISDKNHIPAQESVDDLEVTKQQKFSVRALWPVIACGAGLFSDGYVNNVISSVTTTLGREYGDVYKHSQAATIVSAIAFAGTVVGQLSFGYLSDKWSRMGSLLLSTSILIIFTALSAGSYWHGEPVDMFNMLVAWRFLVGIGIGGEYPAGSVSCAESSVELEKGSRNMWFIFFTNSMIDWGFVFGAFVPYVVAVAAQDKYYSTIWRTSLGIGCVFPMVLFIMRLKLKEPDNFSRNSMRHVRTPYKLTIKFYGWRLLLVSLMWFIYDFSSYSFGIYSTTVLNNIYGDDPPLTHVFGWNTVINLLYIPGTMLGAPLSDKIGPRRALAFGVFAQAIVGFIMAGAYEKLAQPAIVGAFATVYGIFLSLGELGAGNNIGLLAAKSCATGVRGKYYGTAAAMGKIGAFVGTYVFPYIAAAGGSKTTQAQYPFYVSSALCVVSGILALLLPHISQDTIEQEDERFRAYLEEHGWDVSQLGLKVQDSMSAEELGSKTIPTHEETLNRDML